MEEKARELAEAVLTWWEEHKFDTCSTGHGDLDNIFDRVPDFVYKAAEYLGRNPGEL